MKALRVIVPCAVLVAFAGCRTNKDILNDYEKDFLAGDFDHASIEVTEKAAETGGDQLLWRLQAAGANRLAGNSEKAIELFDGAEDIFLENDRASVFSQGVDGTCAMLTNDRAFPFAGGGQDRIYACLYKAIDYLALGNRAAARTELNRAAQHQENWVFERRRDIEAARDRMKKDTDAYVKENKSENRASTNSVSKAFADADFVAQVKEKTGFDPAVDGKLETLSQKDYLNVYAQHVCGVFRWLTGDDGSVYFRGLPEINPACELLARDLTESAARTKPVDQVWIYVEDGLAPCREEWRVDLPLVLIPYVNRYVMYAGMAMPYLRYRDCACPAYAVVAGGEERPLGVLQDMDRLLKVEHDVYFRGALTREITRVIVKAGAQAALGIAYENTSGDYAKIALKASQAALAGYAAAVTQADLRSWTTLPKRIHATRVTRPADGKIVLRGNGANLAEIQLPPGNALVFVTKPSAAAAPAVKVATVAPGL